MLLVYNIVMIRVNMHDAKAKLSSLIASAMEGETVQICKRNVPVVELKAVAKRRVIKGPLGKFKGQIVELPGCWDPMTEEELSLWYDGPIFPTDR